MLRRISVVLLALTAGGAAFGEDVIRLKLSNHMPSLHHQNAVTFAAWAAEIAARSGGRLQIDIYPAEQLGKLSQQYNLVRRGDVDIALIMQGIPAGRFPLIELTHLPVLFESGEQSSQVLTALVPEYLGAEHKGVKVLYLFGHSPGVMHTSSRAVRRPDDVQGLRIRHPSSVVGETLRAWGASPAGMPVSELAGNLEKGVIDGLVIPYDGVLAFRLAPYIDYSTELLSYVNSFGVVMNQDSFDRLPADLQQLIEDTTGMKAAREVGARWDSMEIPGRDYMRTNGVEIIELDDGQRAMFANAAEHLVEQRLASTEALGLPAREFLARVRELAAVYRVPPK
jgi:TRAP-type C4-dicarboxylate transport system substrate-binding protein